jgi:hypothetical protein
VRAKTDLVPILIIAAVVATWSFLHAVWPAWRPVLDVGVVAALFAAAVAAAVWRARQTAHVVADEGGLRVERNSSREYIPYSDLEGADLVGSTLRLHDKRGRRSRTLLLLEGHEADLHPTLLRGIEAAHRTRVEPSIRERLGRHDEALDVWLARIKHSTSESYRERAIDDEALLLLVEDRDGDVELRAAAAYALVGRGDTECARRVRAAAGAHAPPLVVVAAMLAQDEPNVVEATKMLAYLSREDRVAAARLAHPQRVRIETSGSAPPDAGQPRGERVASDAEEEPADLGDDGVAKRRR